MGDNQEGGFEWAVRVGDLFVIEKQVQLVVNCISSLKIFTN